MKKSLETLSVHLLIIIVLLYTSIPFLNESELQKIISALVGGLIALFPISLLRCTYRIIHYRKTKNENENEIILIKVNKTPSDISYLVGKTYTIRQIHNILINSMDLKELSELGNFALCTLGILKSSVLKDFEFDIINN